MVLTWGARLVATINYSSSRKKLASVWVSGLVFFEWWCRCMVYKILLYWSGCWWCFWIYFVCVWIGKFWILCLSIKSKRIGASVFRVFFGDGRCFMVVCILKCGCWVIIWLGEVWVNVSSMCWFCMGIWLKICLSYCKAFLRRMRRVLFARIVSFRISSLRIKIV